jgi:hypothetical protein
MKKLTISLFLLLTIFSLSAANFKIDIDGREKNITLKPGRQLPGIRAVNPSWASAQKNAYLCFEGNVGSGWKKYSITFTPAKSGTVYLNIRASYKNPPAADWVAYDNFRARGTTILNPSMEIITNHTPAHWSLGHFGIVDDGKASHGKYYMAGSGLPGKDRDNTHLTFDGANIVADMFLTLSEKAELPVRKCFK